MTTIIIVFLALGFAGLALNFLNTRRELDLNRIEIERFTGPEGRRAESALFLYRVLLKQAFEDKGVVLIRYTNGQEYEVPLPISSSDWVESDQVNAILTHLDRRSRELKLECEGLDDLAIPFVILTSLFGVGSVGLISLKEWVAASILGVFALIGGTLLRRYNGVVLKAKRNIARIGACIGMVHANEHWTGKAWVYPKDVVDAAQAVYKEVA